MLPEFPMKSFFHAAILSLGLLPGIISTGTAQDFGAMSFGGAGDFGTPQASGTARATVESYAAELENCDFKFMRHAFAVDSGH